MNWSAGALCAALLAASIGALRGATLAARARRAASRLEPGTAPPSTLVTGPFPVPAWVAPRLVAMGVTASPARVFWTWVATAALAAAVALKVGGPGLSMMVVAGACVGPAVAFAVWRTRGDARMEAALPEALEAVARSLRSGASLRLALTEAADRGGALAGDLTRLSAETDHGADMATAIERWGHTRPLPGVRLAVAALCLGVEAGGPQARAIDGVAATLRQRLSVAAEARALGAQARISGLVIAVSPVLFCALASSTDVRTARFLLHTATGQLLLAAGIALDVAGAVWMAYLTKVTT